MARSSDDLLAMLEALGIPAETKGHAPVSTVDEMKQIYGALPGAHAKNLFLRDAKKSFFLVSALHDAKLDLKALRPLIGARGNLSFASADALWDKLGVTPGSVSPFAIVNDHEGVVTVCLQDELLKPPILNFHPLRNDQTTAISADDLLRFLDETGHPPTIFGLAAGAA